MKPNVIVDIDEGRYVREVSCIACRETGAVLAPALPARMYIVALECRDCNAQLVEFDQFSERAAMTFQFFCAEHQYGWSIDEDGLDRGCVLCQASAEEEAN